MSKKFQKAYVHETNLIQLIYIYELLNTAMKFAAQKNKCITPMCWNDMSLNICGCITLQWHHLTSANNVSMMVTHNETDNGIA